jgi:prepilin-type processing-associated H-X9-DG protein/prepilin-type N-terminal cleavage/methylation domain-containing protein
MLRTAIRSRRGFTLAELIMVMAVITVIAGLMMPVLAKARKRAHQAVCLSNLYQLGVAFEMYVQDSDDTLPCGFALRDPSHSDIKGQFVRSSGVGWAAQLYPYDKHDRIFLCPDEPSTAGGLGPGVSYGFNSNLAGHGASRMNAPGKTVLFFEVEGVPADPRLVYPDTPGYYSAAGNGISRKDAVKLGCSTHTNRTDCLNFLSLISEATTGSSAASAAPVDSGSTAKMATGYLGGQYDADTIQPADFTGPLGRHGDGANYQFADGHVKWLQGHRVSPGVAAAGPLCNQATMHRFTRTLPQPPGCGSSFIGAAAGTEQRNVGGGSKYEATFSPI